jgi:hypothetical protein
MSNDDYDGKKSIGAFYETTECVIPSVGTLLSCGCVMHGSPVVHIHIIYSMTYTTWMHIYLYYDCTVVDPTGIYKYIRSLFLNKIKMQDHTVDTLYDEVELELNLNVDTCRPPGFDSDLPS